MVGAAPGAAGGVAALVVVSDFASVRRAREFVGAWCVLHECGELAHLAMLAVSELVTNAVKHAAGVRVTVRVYLADAGLVVEVWDDGAEGPVVRTLDDLAAEDGRGLAMLAELCDGVGWDAVSGGGKAVWALVGAPQWNTSGKVRT